MRASVSSFWLPRGGSPVEQYEDAYYPRRTGVRSGRSLRVAVADGASESMLSGLWARLLVRTWCRSPGRSTTEAVGSAMAEWDASLAAYLRGREVEHRPIEWFETPGLERGAHATLLGLELSGGGDRAGRWSAVALGDSCLFQVRADTLVAAFPFQHAASFGSGPKLVPTRSAQLEKVVANLDHAEGGWEAGDVLFLASDAMAAWFLAGAETGAFPWRTMNRFGGAVAFDTWAGEQRGTGALRNDDLTLMRVEMVAW